MTLTAISERTRQFEKFVYRSIAYPLVLLVLFAMILSWRVLALMYVSHWVDHSDEVIAQANYTQLLAVDEQAGQRGYFVNGNDAYLERYRAAASEIAPAFQTLAKMVKENPEQENRVVAMESQFDAWQGEVSVEINLASQYPNSYREYFDQGREMILMDTLRGEFKDFIHSENELREQRAASTDTATAATLIFSAVLAVVFSIGLSFVWIRQTREFANKYEEALNVSSRNLGLLSATLMSIGDAVLVTDPRGKVLQMNRVAEELTGWNFSDAYGMDADTVFKTVDRTTRAVLESPIRRVAVDGNSVGLSEQAILIRQGGGEIAIDDSCAAIKNEAGQTVGVVLVFRDITERKRAEAELARLYDREHRIAENLQRSLLSKPDPRLFPNLEIETLYQPAWAEAKVGGDYFDIIGLKDGKAGLVVGDVSGKGLKAASRTAEMKFTFRAYLRETSDVFDSVRRLNNFVCQSQTVSNDPNSFFLCMTAIVIDSVTGTAQVCVCGAERPLIIRANGLVEEIASNGSPIGIFESSEFEVAEVQINKGDLIVVVTDGITEARKNQDFLGNEGLATIASHASTNLRLVDVGSEIVDNVKKFADNHLSDDICLLLARRK